MNKETLKCIELHNIYITLFAMRYCYLLLGFYFYLLQIAFGQYMQTNKSSTTWVETKL